MTALRKELTTEDLVAATEHVKSLGRCPPKVLVYEVDHLPVRMPDDCNCHWQWLDGERELHVSPLFNRLLRGDLSFADAFAVCEEIDP